MLNSFPRVVSLLPSATEIVCALGLEEFLVGRSHECDFPHSIQKLPVCSRPIINTHRNSREIDEQVKALASTGISLYEIDTQLLARLRPDVILTQTQCEVCAVSEADVQKAVNQMVKGCPDIISLKPNSLKDIWHDILKIATSLDYPQRGSALVSTLQNQLTQIKARVTCSTTFPTVASLEWLDPLMGAGNWIPELIEFAGGIPVLGQAGKHSAWLSWDDLRQADPDYLLAIPCGWGVRKSIAELLSLSNHPKWNELRAVRNQRVFVADGNQFFNRPGPRIVRSAEIIAEILNMSDRPSRHSTEDWIHFSQREYSSLR